jgi:signal transduction histidine kinase
MLSSIARSAAASMESTWAKIVAGCRTQKGEPLQGRGSGMAANESVAGLAHDLSNPVTAIQGYCSLLREEAVDNGLLRTGVRTIEAAANEAASLTRLLLILSSNRPAEIDRPLVGVAHDLGGLLTLIGNYCAFLLDGASRGSIAHADLKEVGRATESALSLVQQMLDPDDSALEARHLDLNEVICELLRSVELLVGEDIELDIDLDPEIGLVEIAPQQIERVLLNLVTNARDAMPDGGRLTIRTGNAELSPQARRGYVTLSVSDTGCGMDEGTQARLFEPLFTTKGDHGGIGLGLFTASRIIDDSDGQILVDSQPGRGSTFRICLPRIGDSYGCTTGA